jgi:isocitrate lyase
LNCLKPTKEEWPDILNYKKRICVATTRIQSRKTPGFVGTSYFDAVNTVTIGKSSTTAMKDSTETAVF